MVVGNYYFDVVGSSALLKHDPPKVAQETRSDSISHFLKLFFENVIYAYTISYPPIEVLHSFSGMILPQNLPASFCQLCLLFTQKLFFLLIRYGKYLTLPPSQPERQGSVLNSMLQLTIQCCDRSRKQPLFHFGFSCTSDLDFPAQYSNFCCLYIDTLSQSQTLGLRKGRARASSNIPSLTFMERMLLLSVGFWDDRFFFFVSSGSV